MFDLHQFAAVAPDLYPRLKYYKQLESTNDEARNLAEQGAEHGSIVLADHQTRGRGRRGAAWLSEPGDGLLFSIVLRPDFAKDKWSRIALVAGLGMVTDLNEVWGLHAQVKWPNDIYLQDRKCAGILTEAGDGFVILGVGLNVYGAPKSITYDAQPVALSTVTQVSISREKVLAVILYAIMREVDACGEDFENQLTRLQKVFYLTGKDIEFTVGNDRLSGRALGVSAQGALEVEMPNGLELFPQASEIRVT